MACIDLFRPGWILKKTQKLKFFPLFLIYICVIDQAWVQNGWILARWFVAYFIDRDRAEANKNAKEANNQPSWLHTRSTKDLLYCQKENVFFRDPSGAHLARSSSQSQHRIRFTLPARGFNHRCLVTATSPKCYPHKIPEEKSVSFFKLSWSLLISSQPGRKTRIAPS